MLEKFGIQVSESFRKKGKSVKIGYGPAAVTGDESHNMSLSALGEWEDVMSRMIRESENLPV